MRRRGAIDTGKIAHVLLPIPEQGIAEFPFGHVGLRLDRLRRGLAGGIIHGRYPEACHD